ncbi:MAG: hypothetical protein R2704_02445 [Microthrixaceae bacterium]
MAEPMRVPNGGKIDDLEQREFSRVRKGYEPSEVRATLVQTAAELRRLRAERGRLSDELTAARAETERVRRQTESAPVVLPDDAELTRVLGEEMVKLLDDARTTAAGIAERAESAAADVVSEAEAEATARMERLEEELAERRAEAEAEEREILERANAVLAERTEAAEEAAAELADLAENELAEAREAAREHIEAGKEEGRRLVVEAKTFRERILRDLAGRRKLARKQLEAMRAAQERLLGAFTACAVAVESATSELHTALPEAKVAADDAAKRVTDDIEDVVVAMEAAIATGELPAVVLGEIGRPDLSGRSQLRSAALPVRHELESEGADEGADATAEVATDTAIEEDADEAGEAPSPEHPEAGFEIEADAADGATSTDADIDAEEALDHTPSGDTEVSAAAESLDDEATGEHSVVGDTGDADWADLDVDDLLGESDEPEHDEAAPSGQGRDHLRLVPGDAAVDGPAAEADAVDAPETEPGSDGASTEPAAAAEGADDEPKVGDLFSRLRAERDEAVAQARQTLGAEADDSEVSAAVSDDDQADEVVAEADAEEIAEADDEPAVAFGGSEADQILDRRDDSIGPIERGVSRRVKRLVDDEQNELLDALRRSRRNVTMAALLPDDEEQVASLVELLSSDLTDAVAAGAASVAARSGTPVALGRKNLERLADQLRPVIAARLVNPWRDEVASLIAEEPDRAQLGERLRAAYRERKTVDLPELASGVVVVAYNVGVAAAAKTGPGLEWVLDHGGEEVEAHLPRVRGGNPGEAIAALSSPEVPDGCRCLLVTRSR